MLFDCNMKRLHSILLLATVAVSGCSDPQEPGPFLDTEIAKFIGRDCIVQIRRDYLGGAGTEVTSATAYDVNGSDVSIFGTIREVDKKGILIQDQRKEHRREYWIPEQSILLIEMR